MNFKRGKDKPGFYKLQVGQAPGQSLKLQNILRISALVTHTDNRTQTHRDLPLGSLNGTHTMVSV